MKRVLLLPALLAVLAAGLLAGCGSSTPATLKLTAAATTPAQTAQAALVAEAKDEAAATTAVDNADKVMTNKGGLASLANAKTELASAESSNQAGQSALAPPPPVTTTTATTPPPVTTTATTPPPVTTTATTPPPVTTTGTTTTPPVTTTTAPPPSTGATVVGIDAEPAVTCTQTITPPTTIRTALNKATAGSTVCLNGTWTATQYVQATTFSSNVTVAAASPGSAVLSGGISIGYGLVSNVTFEGIQFGGGIAFDDCASDIAFLDNNFQDLANVSAFYFYYGENGDSNCTQSNIVIAYNQIDHAGECLEVDSPHPSAPFPETGIDFSHNVCGPDIGYEYSGGTSGHYIQIGNTSDDTFDNNAFEGPVDPSIGNCTGPHVNVFHITGNSSDVDFSNNVLWHTQACGETILEQSGYQTNNTVDNNLIVEDTGVGISVNLYGLDNATFNENTVIAVDGGSGVDFTGNCTDCGTGYLTDQNVTANNNLTVGDPGWGEFSCTGTCADTGNISDSTAPAFITTAWTPTSGSPWAPPPQGYYQPVSGTAGYQSPVGP